MQYMVTLAPSFIALIAVIIAANQWLVARNKLRLDLYNRRFAIYENLLTFYLELTQKTENINQSRLNFIKSTRESIFLFASDETIHELLVEILRKSAAILEYEDLKQVTGEARDSELHERKIDAEFWILKQIPIIEEKMKPFLVFKAKS